MENFIKRFADITVDDIYQVGSKNAYLGEMYRHLRPKGVLIPDGFAVTADAFKYFIISNNLRGQLNYLMKNLETDFSNLSETGADSRELIMEAHMPNDLGMAIINAYYDLFELEEGSIAVRSSSNDELMPSRDFVGLHRSYLNVGGTSALLYSIRECFASLYTDEAIKYRQEKEILHYETFISVGVQKMVRADKACSGIALTCGPDSDCASAIYIAGIWGLGNNMADKSISPDEFLIFKPSLSFADGSLIERTMGEKFTMLTYANEDDESNTTICKSTPYELRGKYVLGDCEIEKLGKWALLIEDYYKQPMAFEWAKDGQDHQLYLLQVMPAREISVSFS